MNKRRNNNERKRINLWKWSFLFLVAIIMGIVICFVRSIQPVDTQNQSVADTALVSEENKEIKLSTSINKEDTEWLVNTYLHETLGEDFSFYEVRLTNQLELHGNIDFLNFEIPFALYFSPFALENGNLQLRGEAVELANFSLPVSTVMSLFANQIDIPDFIDVNSQQRIIVIYLDVLTSEYTFDISISNFNLEENKIELDLFFNEQDIYNNIQLIEGN